MDHAKFYAAQRRAQRLSLDGDATEPSPCPSTQIQQAPAAPTLAMVLSDPVVRGYADPEVGAGGDATMGFALTLTTAATSPVASLTYDLEMTAL